MFDKLAEELRLARERHGITLVQLANKTRVDLKFLQAIDDGNFSFLPELYVKAFLKDYARNVGLDENAILKKYQALKEGKAYSAPESSLSKEDIKKAEETAKPEEPAKSEKPEPPKEVKREPVKLQPTTTQFDSFKGSDRNENQGANTQRNLIIAAGAGALVVVAIIIWFFFIRQSNEIIVPEKSYDEIVKENSDRYSDLQPKQEPKSETTAVQPVAADSLRLVIKSSDTSWVKILVDNTRSEEFMLYPGSQKQLIAKENYKGVFGKSKSIQLELNGKPLAFDNQGRNVLNAVIDSGGVHINSPSKKTDTKSKGQ